MQDTDYERLMIDDTFDLIVNRNPWPVTWLRARKIQLIDRLIRYYTDHDEFEKCGILQKKKDEILKKKK